MLFLAFLLEVIWILAADGGQHWTYEGPHGQDHWPASYPECGSNAQSPIDIQTDSVTFDPELPALQPHGYDQPGTEPLDLHNNGHTVQLSLPPTLYLGGLPRKYVAAQLHLHWGQKGSPGGSEHQINSEATAAELHIVHYDSDSYDSLSEAAQRPQGLAVLGILIEVGETKNIAYEHILSHLHEIRHKEDLSVSLQREGAAPHRAWAVLPLQWLAHNSPLLPKCALDSLQSKGPDFNGAAGKAPGDIVLHRRALQAPGTELPSPSASQSAHGLCFFHPSGILVYHR
ncbi:carbonic anhydrase 14 isoform X4 [Lemur catta]|uniref:carbonic anhydrase 14 isoform X4 n=1 Tax=Lemur catta TaxID=9447 RepID=UPI001E26BD4A|nr:carbonic anhydrase 14 isoform X4 [Lemur catta]